MCNFQITPKVDETQEFIEIANDFSNPLDIVREAISNAFDAEAKKIEIIFNVIEEYGEKILQIVLQDDGYGMNREGLQSFFDLGNSLSRGNSDKIGEKGHGTKVYFNSSEIKVITVSDNKKFVATMLEPFKNLFSRIVPVVNVSEENIEESDFIGTRIEIKGYNSNRRDKFTHEQLKDYILWFTKCGSFETHFGYENHNDVNIIFKGLNRDDLESIRFGHSFPDESDSVDRLFEQHNVSAPDYYCKRIIKSGHLKNFPEIKYQAIFSVEGNKVKQAHNPMIRRQGVSVIPGSYSVADRYGIWLCKDFIPVQRKNEWVNYKGSEYIKFHSFFNCQGLHLTANRGSIDNTPSEVLSDIENEVRKIYADIVESNDWTNLSWLEQEAEGYRTAEKERKEFNFRITKVNQSNICEFNDNILVEPKRESGVFALTLQLQTLDKSIFPFYILDYDTHSGVDVIVKGDNTTPIQSSKLYYVEFKHILTPDFNHSFSNLHSIVCWDTNVKHDDNLKDINGEQRRFSITQPAGENEYTKYFLDNPRSPYRIEVFVLKDYLKQKLGIDFRPRTVTDTV
jgi:hypothetical protein